MTARSSPQAARRSTHRARLPHLSTGTIVAVVMIVLALAIGAATAASPVLGLAVAGVLAFVYLLSLGRRAVPIFHVTLIAILIGLAFFGRGFAYLGVRPLYISELALVMAIVAILVSPGQIRWRPIHVAIAVFIGWGIVRTVPYVGSYGIDALRDGVVFGYAVFAFAVSMTVKREHVERLLPLYRRWFPVFLLWVPLAAVSAAVLVDVLPVVPGSTVPIIVFKAGDTGVHLGAFGAFMLLGLGGSNAGGIRDWVVWSLWFLALAMTSIISRGGMVAAAMMATSILFARASGRWLSLILVGIFLVSVVALADPQIDIGRARRLSVEQAVANVVSVFGIGNNEVGHLEVTKQWRLAWWDTIIDYTINGPYFWTGKGFGINLADDDGFQVEADGSLRAPHNGHIALLARGGVPMLALWIVVGATYLVMLLRAARRASRAGLDLWVKVIGWVFVYWIAALVNAAFDVYLEGPMGGIWFWSMIGLGTAVVGFVDDDIAARARRGPAAESVRAASPPRPARPSSP